MSTLLRNVRVFDGSNIISGHAVEIAHGRVSRLIAEVNISGDQGEDLSGALLAPGFVDLQVNGGGGRLLPDGPLDETLTIMAQAHRKYGTTTMLPTLISTSWENMILFASAVAEAVRINVPGIRGAHFEGPYLNPAKRGAHAARSLRMFDPGAMELFKRKDMGVVKVTIAPECLASGTIRALVDNGVIVSAGHTIATFDQMSAAFDEGLSGVTHLFNAMSQFSSREAGVVGAALDNPNCFAGIIADGHHVSDASMRVALKAKGQGRICLVTDSMATVGAAQKRFMLNGETIIARNGRCATAEGTLAGSDLDMASAIRYMVKNLNFSVEEALRMATLYPATWIGLNHCIGRIAPDYDADFVLLDLGLNVQKTWVRGCSD